jgi:UDP:flavonoid glycosyltransferase YjiC (YdhE family)
MRILFSFAGGLGHANPMAPIARACLARGHSVAFAGRSSATEVLSGQGFEVFTDPDDGRRPSSETALEITPLVEIDMEREYEVLRTYFAGRLTRSRVPIVSDVCETWRPDVVVNDEVDYGGMISAELRGVPHATVLSLASSFVRNAGVAGHVDAIRSESGLRPDGDLLMPGRELVLSPFPPSLREADLPGARAAPFRHTVADPERSRRGATPSVYFTLGTEFNVESGDLFDRVLAGLGASGVESVVTVGREVDPSRFGEQPASIRIRRFVPQEETLPECDVVINHGGSGSTLGALSFGRPMIVIPLGADQLLNASTCEDLGVAVALDALRLTPDDVRRAIDRLLMEPGYRAAAQRISDEIAALPPAASVVARLAALSGRS